MRHQRRRTGQGTIRNGRRRGVATVEAVVALPVFLLILFSVLYVHELKVARQQALVEARRCAWTYAVDGCDRKPPDCPDPEGAGEVPGSKEVARDMDNDLEDIRKEVETTESFLQSLSEIPVLGHAIEALFGESTRAVGVRQVDRPGPLGGGQVAVVGEVVLTCNTRPTSKQTMIEDIVEGVLGKFF